MQENPFVTLGVSENATQNELFEAYKDLRAKYSDMRFSPGEKGAEACRMLEEIESAYARATDILRSRFEISNYGDDLVRIEDAIKENDLEKAQDLLDGEQNRNAKWHYLQSVIFYRKNWLNDALKQLDFACKMDPDNTKYAEARDALLNQIRTGGDQKGSFYNERNNGNGRSYRDVPPQGEMRGCTPCNCCTSLICADCCCECMGGDLIACC